MLKIRLQRIGRKGRPSYRIVVAEHSDRVKGRYVERVGLYDPIVNPKVFEFDQAKIEEWMKKGAKPSSTLARLLKGAGVKNMDAYIDEMVDKKKKNAPEEEEKPEAAAPAAPAAESTPKADESTEEAPAEEPKAEEPAPEAEKPAEEVKEEAPTEEAPTEEPKVEESAEEKVEEKVEETPAQESSEEEKSE